MIYEKEKIPRNTDDGTISYNLEHVSRGAVARAAS